MTATALLRAIRARAKHEIRKGLEGNLCRCTGYTNIVDAVQSASERDGRWRRLVAAVAVAAGGHERHGDQHR